MHSHHFKRQLHLHLFEKQNLQTKNSKFIIFFNNAREWEEKIANYFGDDVLSLWKEYIQWIEDNYPSLNKESGIINVLERCTRSLLHEEKYKDDLRYLQIWLKYVSIALYFSLVGRFM